MATYLDRIAVQKIADVDRLAPAPTCRSARIIDGGKLPGKKPFIIAEIKRSSPSEGPIRLEADVRKIARAYRDNGAEMISVLTDEHFFQGGFDVLREVRETVDLPILCKDFIIGEKQIDHAWAGGADMILLIAAMHDAGTINRLAGHARSRGLEVLFEIHDLSEYPIIQGAHPRFVGVNSRNLATFVTDPFHAAEVIRGLPQSPVIIAESGITSPEDVFFYRDAGATGFLVGTSLMKADDPGAALAQLLRGIG